VYIESTVNIFLSSCCKSILIFSNTPLEAIVVDKLVASLASDID
jgi:hypothetical protein